MNEFLNFSKLIAIHDSITVSEYLSNKYNLSEHKRNHIQMELQENLEKEYNEVFVKLKKKPKVKIDDIEKFKNKNVVNEYDYSDMTKTKNIDESENDN